MKCLFKKSNYAIGKTANKAKIKELLLFVTFLGNLESNFLPEDL
jgi:hypothetical protein